VETEEGGTIKARRMESEAAALRQQELRAELDPVFAPVLARSGAVLLEQWIEGRPLNEIPATPAMIRRSAAILAGLHAVASAGARCLPFRADLSDLLGETGSGLQSILAAGALDRPTVARLHAIVANAAPGESRHCLIHTDLCAENIVVDDSGRLFVVDNEHFRFGPAGMDMARSWYRWGWHVAGEASGGWEIFRLAYESAGGDPEALLHEPFWRIAAVVVSARLRLHLGIEKAAIPLGCLRNIARVGDA
jgi:aminoglycoside phosphotransferase (APT) family kinase protein